MCISNVYLHTFVDIGTRVCDFAFLSICVGLYTGFTFTL